jgi:hypothetical protein
MTDEKAQEIVAGRDGKCTFNGAWLQIEPYVEYNQDAVVQCPKCGDQDRWGHRLPDYLNSHNALQPVLVKMTPEEQKKLVQILYTNFGVALTITQPFIWWILTLPARDLCRAIAETIEQCKL